MIDDLICHFVYYRRVIGYKISQGLNLTCWYITMCNSLLFSHHLWVFSGLAFQDGKCFRHETQNILDPHFVYSIEPIFKVILNHYMRLKTYFRASPSMKPWCRIRLVAIAPGCREFAVISTPSSCRWRYHILLVLLSTHHRNSFPERVNHIPLIQKHYQYQKRSSRQSNKHPAHSLTQILVSHDLIA